MSPTELIRLVRELGPVWGVIAVCTLAFIGLAQYRWTPIGIEGLVADPLMRMAALGFLVGVPLYLVVYNYCFARRRGLPSPFSQDEVGVLVASIPGDEDRRLQQTYAQAIRVLTAETSEIADAVKIRLLERLLPNDPDRQHQEALILGKRLRASFVLRAVRVEGGFQSWISIVRSRAFSKPEAHLGKINEQQLAELEALPLPLQVTLFARCACALSLYRNEKYEAAVRSLREIVALPQLPPGSPSRPFLLFLLGNSYLSGRFRDPPTFLACAVAAYDEVLSEWSREINPNEWIDAVLNKASALLLTTSNVAANAAEVERLCSIALTEELRKTEPHRWARLLTNRASACLCLERSTPSDCEEAVGYLSAAQSVVSRRKDPYLWASITKIRGLIHAQIHRKNEDENIKQRAIADLRASLEVFERSKYPYDWGVTMMGLASVYLIPPDEDKFVQGMEYLDALEALFTREAFPLEWAQRQRLCGTALFIMSLVDEDKLQDSINSLEAALEVFDSLRYPLERARTLGGLSVAFSHGTATEARLKLALRHAEEATMIYQREKLESDAENLRSVADDLKQQLQQASVMNSGQRHDPALGGNGSVMRVPGEPRT